MMKFLNSNTVQSTLRLVVFMIAFGVFINLGALPFLIALAITAHQNLSWIGYYVASLAALSGANVLGKALQKKYEGVQSDNYEKDEVPNKSIKGSQENKDTFLEEDRHM